MAPRPVGPKNAPGAKQDGEAGNYAAPERTSGRKRKKKKKGVREKNTTSFEILR